MGDTIYSVQKGDSSYVVAKKMLQQAGDKNITNKEICTEMARLANLKECNNYEDSNKKFFEAVGIEIKPKKAQPKQITSKQDQFLSAKDTIYKSQSESSLLSIANGDSVQKRDAVSVVTPRSIQKLQPEVDRINSMENDKDRVIAYNKGKIEDNYIIVDKKTCQATIYSPDGKPLKSYEVGIGKEKGDKMSTAFAADSAKRVYTTVPGEYSFTSAGNTHGGILNMGRSNETMDPDVAQRPDAPGSGGKRKFGVAYQAMHKIPHNVIKQRGAAFGNDTLADNRMSMGCVNIQDKDFEDIQKKYQIGVNSKIYILPEEKGNKLQLERQNDGTTRFVTTYADIVQNQKADKRRKIIHDKDMAVINAEKEKTKKIELAKPWWERMFS